MPKTKNRTKPLKLDDLDALADCVDSLDATSFMTPQRRVHFEVHLKGTQTLFAIRPELLREVQKQAHRRKVNPETLINRWIREKLGPPKSRRKVKAG